MGAVAENYAKPSAVTENLAKYIDEKGISLQKVSEQTGIPVNALYNSLGAKTSSNRTRNLRDYELLEICQFLEIDPMRFLDKKED